MKQLFYFFLIISAISCGKIKPEGKIQSKDTNIEDFTKINLEGKFRVFFLKGDKSFVNVETYPNIASNLNIKVKDKALIISENRPTKAVDFYNITIYSKYFPQEIALTDSVEMNISGAIKTDYLKVNLKNNAKFIGAIDTRKTDLEMYNLSRANFSGFTKNATMKIMDTASFISPYWQIDNLNIDFKNGGYAEVNVKDSLKGKIQNTAKLLYYNDPIRAFKIDKNATVNNKKLD